MKQPLPITLEETAAALQRAARLIITTHVRADGDAVGSALALQRVLLQQGRQVEVWLHEPILDRYAFLAETAAPPVWQAETAPALLASADLLVLVDTCAGEQLRDLAGPFRAAPVPKLAIDHHLTRDDIAEHILLDDRAAACAQIIHRLCRRAGWPLDPTAATMLLAGLATDTGWFRFSNTEAATLEAAADLLATGARPNELYERLYLTDVPARARLAGHVLSSFELHAGGRLAVVRITRETLDRCGATREMTEDLINEPQRVGSVVACVLLVESDGLIRVSLRSKRGVDVAALAARHGGGGHARAAGTRITGTMDEVANLVIGEMIAALDGAG